MNGLGFFLGIIVVFFAIWVASGGPDRPLSLAGPYIAPLAIGATSTDSRIGSYDYFGSATASGGANSSPSFGLVTLSRDITGAKQTDADKEYVVVGLSGAAHEGVDITGWKLVSKDTGRSAVIPRGVGLPSAGRVNQSADVMLSPGQQAIIATGKSPVGISFRENACTGYLGEHQEFSPSLTSACPTPIPEFNKYFTAEDPGDDCVAYLRSIPQCTTATRFPSGLDSSCRSFVEHQLTYEGCVDAHVNDENFYGSTWRLFLGLSDDLWRDSRDTILLEDAGGRVVDSISY